MKSLKNLSSKTQYKSPATFSKWSSFSKLLLTTYSGIKIPGEARRAAVISVLLSKAKKKRKTLQQQGILAHAFRGHLIVELLKLKSLPKLTFDPAENLI